jgi:hypothetical protein
MVFILDAIANKQKWRTTKIKYPFLKAGNPAQHSSCSSQCRREREIKRERDRERERERDRERERQLCAQKGEKTTKQCHTYFKGPITGR